MNPTTNKPFLSLKVENGHKQRWTYKTQHEDKQNNNNIKHNTNN